MYETGLFGNSHELTEGNLERLENGNPSEQVQPFPIKPNVGTDTLHDFHGCEKVSLETLIGG